MDSPFVAPSLSGTVIGSAANAFVIAEWRDPGAPVGSRRLIAPPHLHHCDDEAWYVLEGALHIQKNSEVVEARAGSAVFVPRGTPHTYWNPQPVPCRYLLVMTANIYALIQDIHALPDRSPAALKAVFQKHDSALVDLPQP